LAALILPGPVALMLRPMRRERNQGRRALLCRQKWLAQLQRANLGPQLQRKVRALILEQIMPYREHTILMVDIPRLLFLHRMPEIKLLPLALLLFQPQFLP
jgi:hypothetical protein